MPRPRSRNAPVDELVGSAAATVRWAERLLSAHEPALTLAQYLALHSIRRGPVTAAELARRAGISGPAASQLLSTVESAGWVTRTPFAHDRRSHELALTGTGARVLASANDVLHRSLAELEAILGGDPPPRRHRPPRPPEGPRPKPR
jgi:DNA-binding MarR family transcriptional regulator